MSKKSKARLRQESEVERRRRRDLDEQKKPIRIPQRIAQTCHHEFGIAGLGGNFRCRKCGQWE